MDDCRGTCYVFGHSMEDTAMYCHRYCIEAEGSVDSLKFPIANLTQAMVHNIVPFLSGLGRVSNNVYNGNELSVTASYGAHV